MPFVPSILSLPSLSSLAVKPVRLAAAGLAFAASAALAANPSVAPVGDATLVIGVVRIASSDGVMRPLERGDAIREGDRIETEAGGHVHLRFVDGGRLSVRPFSRLQIENYRHSDQQPALSAIKFRLDEGVVRSITGSWGEAARDRFRLNTPVAAIGVKGTDFVVTTDANKTVASVYTGAIVLAPLADGCQGSLGPCQNGHEKLLSGAMKGQMIALYREQTSPQIVGAAEFLAQAQAQVQSVAQVRRADATPGITQPVADRSPASNASQIATAVVDQTVAPLLVDPIKPPVTPPVTEPPVVPPVVPPVIPPIVVPVLPPEVHQLAWARMSWTNKIDGDLLSVAFDQASKAGYEGTVGNGAYSLYRDGATNGILVAQEAAASFRLAGGIGQLATAQGRVTEAVQVNSGTLNVDFGRATFDTTLNLSSPTLGVDNLTANGIVRPNGALAGQGGNGYVAGALSLNGQEAGYFFEKLVPAGALSGITLWGR